MKKTTSVILLFVLWNTGVARGEDKPEPITMSEAEILIYLMPASQELRKEGFDVGWDVAGSQDPDQFQFHVFNAKRKCPEGCSVTVGHFSVNRHTAEVTDTDMNATVTNQEFSGVQTILRSAHHLGLRKSN